jgi:hypothetical protein
MISKSSSAKDFMPRQHYISNFVSKVSVTFTLWGRASQALITTNEPFDIDRLRIDDLMGYYRVATSGAMQKTPFTN